MFTSFDACVLFSRPKIERYITTKNTPFCFTNKKPSTNTHLHILHPVSSKKKNAKTLFGVEPTGCFFNLSTAFHGPRPGMLERRLGTHQQTALGRLGSFGSGVLGTVEVNF